MNVFRRAGVAALIALATVLALGVFQSSAEAGGGCHYGYGLAKYPSLYSAHTSFYAPSCYPKCYVPTFNHHRCYGVTKRISYASYPVTLYDCYGRPYVVWQTGYSANRLW